MKRVGHGRVKLTCRGCAYVDQAKVRSLTGLRLWCFPRALQWLGPDDHAKGQMYDVQGLPGVK